MISSVFARNMTGHVKFAQPVRDGSVGEPEVELKARQTPQALPSFHSIMGRPADSTSTTDESLTVRDNRTGKTYTLPYVTLRRKALWSD